MKSLVIFLIHLYRWLISPFTPPSCRFEPTCSRYAINCIETHGLAKGLWLTLKRLVRCHPYENLTKNIENAWSYKPLTKKTVANPPIHTNHLQKH